MCLIKYCTDCTDGTCLCPVLHYCPVLYNSSKSIRLNRHWDIFIKKYSDLFRAGILVTETGQWTEQWPVSWSRVTLVLQLHSLSSDDALVAY